MATKQEAKEKNTAAKRSEPKKGGKKGKGAEESLSVEAREEVREQLDRDVAAFLQAGGKIQEIEPNVTADPPRKPTSNYGSRPI